MTSADSAPCSIELSEKLSEQERQLLEQLLPSLPVTVAKSADALAIVAVVDGRGLACPLPLLKTKVALRSVDVGQALYVVATDPNSTADIAAFCRQSGAKMLSDSASAQLQLRLHHQSDGQSNQETQLNESPQKSTLDNNSAKRLAADTLFHFIITKTDSNCA